MRKGYVHVYTGEGKGKTTAALGLAFRAIGCGHKVWLVQFLKGTPTGELHSAARLSDSIEVLRFAQSHKFYWELTEDEKETYHQVVQPELTHITEGITTGRADVIILDEIFAALRYDIVTLEQVLSWIKHKASHVELVLTGRDVPQEIIEAADVVTSMTKIKHYYEQGIVARKGVEF